VIIPPSPGVLCAYGDATTSVRDEAARTHIRIFSELTDDELREVLDGLAERVRDTLAAQGVPESEQKVTFQVDIRYHGQGFEIPIDIDDAVLAGDTVLGDLRRAFDEEHQRLFSFLLPNEHELVNARASASGPRPGVAPPTLPVGDGDPSHAKRSTTTIWVDGSEVTARVYDRNLLHAGDQVTGPAIVTEMDSTTLVLPGHTATVHASGSLLIRPTQEA
jgi:N-methylhydantoinase A